MLAHVSIMRCIKSIRPSIIYLSKTSEHINRANQFKNIGLDAKVHVGLLNRLHVAHKKYEVIITIT